MSRTVEQPRKHRGGQPGNRNARKGSLEGVEVVTIDRVALLREAARIATLAMTRCETCGQLIHPRFKHHHWKVKDIPMGEWTPHGRGAFRVVEYVI